MPGSRVCLNRCIKCCTQLWNYTKCSVSKSHYFELSSSPEGSISAVSCACNNRYTGQNSAVCSICVHGTFKTTSLTCTGWPASTYSSLEAQNTVSAYNPCEIEKYAGVVGSIECMACEPGEYQESTNQLQCLSCPTFQASGIGFSSCVLCDIGKFWSVETSACKDCAVPTYKSQAGSAVCQLCEPDSVFISISDSVLSKTAIFPGMRGGNVAQFQWICTGFVAPRGQCLGKHQRRTAWWARHSEDTTNDHLVQTCLYSTNNRDPFLWPSQPLKRTSTKYVVIEQILN